MLKLYSLLFNLLKKVLRLLGMLGNKSVNQRISFENKNHNDPNSKSYKLDKIVAKIAIEVASEGELEQIMPLIRNYFCAKNNIELIYSSESVEERIQSLHLQYPGQLRSLRLPVISEQTIYGGQNIEDWVTAKKLIIVRYDFYPSLLKIAKSSEVESILVWATFTQYYKSLNVFKRYFLTTIYQCFDKIVFATPRDEQFVKKLNLNSYEGKQFDFRPANIIYRLEHAKETIRKKDLALMKLAELIESYPDDKRVIFGSLWASDVGDENENIDYSSAIHCVIPHKISGNDKENLLASIKTFWGNPKIYEINENSIEEDVNNLIDGHKDNPGIVVINLKGVLVELYPLFCRAYVGGGFEVSIHSLFEPFMAGCNIVCGPQVHRSSEYDLIYEYSPDSIKVVNKNSNMIKFIMGLNFNKNNFKNFNTEKYNEIIEWI